MRMKQGIAGVVLGLMLSPAWAMQALNETQLSDATGQDGMTVSIAPASGKIVFSSLDYTDTDGIATAINGTSYTSPGALVASMNSASGVLLCTNTSGACTASTLPITVDVDADGGAGQGGTPMLSLSIKMPSNLARMRIDVASLGLRADAWTGGVPGTYPVVRGATTTPLVTFSSGIDVVLATGTNINLGLVLGNESSTDTTRNAMLNINSLNIATLDLGTVSLVSSGGQAGESSLRADVQLTGLDLSGADVNVTAAGVVLSKSSLGPFNLRLNNIMAGTAGLVSAGLFGDLQNGSMGSVGVNGIQMTNPKFTVSGL